MATRASRIALAGSNISSTGEVDADLLDNTDSAAFLSLDGSGRLGIGTTSPDAKLEVSNITANDLPFIISGGTASLGSLPETTGMLFGYGSGAVYKKGAIIWEFTETNARGKLHFCNDGNADSANAQLSDSKMTIDKVGNVGIGTSSPSEQLHIFNSSQSWNAYARIRLGTESSSHEGSLGYHRGTSSDADRGLYLSGSGTTKHVNVRYNGSVGIGNNIPTYKLDVGGTTEIQARLKSNGGTGWTQGALIIESSDSTSNPGNRGQGVYSYNVPNQRTWYSGTLYNNGNKFGIGYQQASGFQAIAADNAKAKLVIDGDNGSVGIGNTSNLSNNLGKLLNVANATVIGNNTSGAYFGYNVRYDSTWKRNETSAVGLLSFTNSGALTFRQAVSGNAGTEPSLTEAFSVSTAGQLNAKLSATTAAMVRATGTVTGHNAIIANNAGNITWGIKSASNSSWYSVSGDRFTILKSGLVSLNVAQDMISVGATGYAQARVLINGTIDQYMLCTNTNGQWDSIGINWCGKLNVNDYIQLYFNANDITNFDYGNWSNYDFTWISQ